jgi:tRNA modification GTPase
MADTIFALSSGPPPAAISVVRVSGPAAGAALQCLSGPLPKPRVASLRTLRGSDGEALDRALVLWFPGPNTATGEDLAELHLHGGRAVVAATERALAALPGLRAAQPGEFTRRAFANGRMDLAQAEGLADLLSAETELQRRQAMALAEGRLSQQVSGWRDRILIASAMIEASLDFDDEDDVPSIPATFAEDTASLAVELADILGQPRAEALQEGFRVVLAGPPNAGKSSLFNRIVRDEAAIVTPIAGTTRDVLTRSVAIDGVPFVFVDTAGLRSDAADSIEGMGIERAERELVNADLVLWLGPPRKGCAASVWQIQSFADLGGRQGEVRHAISSVTGEGINDLLGDLVAHARLALPKPGSVALNKRQHELIAQAEAGLAAASRQSDPLLAAEELRRARVAMDRLLGRAATEDMLDALFGRFCIGK